MVSDEVWAIRRLMFTSTAKSQTCRTTASLTWDPLPTPLRVTSELHIPTNRGAPRPSPLLFLPKLCAAFYLPLLLLSRSPNTLWQISVLCWCMSLSGCSRLVTIWGWSWPSNACRESSLCVSHSPLQGHLGVGKRQGGDTAETRCWTLY